ncbi:MAG: hypothetical protein J7605_17295 [Variovorax sp.]|nr:hypothetical protein [Variovorax sp.]
MHESHELPVLSITTWGADSPAMRQAVGAAIAQHTIRWAREQRRRQEAEQLAGLVREALIDGKLTTAEIARLLMPAPPPAPGLRERIFGVLRRWLVPSSRKGALHD